MEYPNLHHQQLHQLQEEYDGHSQRMFSTTLSTSHDLNSAMPLNDTTTNHMYRTKYIPNLRDFRSNYPEFGQTDTTGNNLQQSINQLFNENGMKEKMSESTLDRFNQGFCNSDDIEKPSFLSSSIYKQQLCSEPSTWLNNLSTRPLLSRDLYCDGRNGAATSSFNLSHVLPSTTRPVSTWDVNSQQLFSSSFGLTLPTLDLLTSSNYGGISSHSSHDKHHHLRECISSNLEQMHASTNQSVFNNGSATRKRAINHSVPKELHAETKKQRVSCQPTKVREKVAALQRLVAPFGKIDQATVLTEAIGYIQFLQDQVQTLSVPYMKSSHGNPSRMIGQVSSNSDRRDETHEDLRSRGLCLVPLSLAATYINYD